MARKKIKIICRYCNKVMENFRELDRHNCPNKEKHKKLWRASIGRSKKCEWTKWVEDNKKRLIRKPYGNVKETGIYARVT